MAFRVRAAIAAVLLVVAPLAAARTLDIYFIDVEGGQATLVVTPAGQTLLIDTGFPSDGTFASQPGDPHKARDADRILAAATAAGLTRIDMLLLTHFHPDHVGGVPELAQLLPIGTFIDHGGVNDDAESVEGSQAAWDRYAALRAKGRHLEPKPGDHIPLKDVDVTVVSAARDTIKTPLPGAGAANTACGAMLPAQEPTENTRSTGIRLRFGKFGFLDVGDLTGEPLFALACPRSLVGPVDVYLVAHHGGSDASDPATFAAFRPRVAILNSGATKGGGAETFATLHAAKLEDVWQLHRTTNAGAANFADGNIANLDETTSHWIKLSAGEDGAFTITNGRTGETKSYPAPAAR